ncbi:YCF48-related protein [Aromatoleum toluclasticum]|uniref:WD40/YVTN/BNR-like repeat-containing protein n=1 Tax=Aromatoleum toluclasticum TaxID=92003 RepID=UPI001D18AD6F|nr:YCF48-related protein [Aromatoleum toluclasticum]MCC4118763.1 YCF48-related protein [Aromatoleum toluclasticum]
MNVHRICGALAALALLMPAAAPAAGFQDVLDVPAMASELAAKGLINGLAQAGQRVVGVGQRGHVVYSDDQGRSWRQAKVPVSSDLVAVSFPTPQQGWAVGHDGVVLATSDAGATWTKQLDGRALGEVMLAHYKARGEAAWIAEAERFAAQGAENPFLDVWFADERTGFVVGAFNLILRTTDGGKSWTPWLDRTDNPQALHLYAIRPAGGDVYVTGEQGLVLRLDAAAGRFTRVETPYKGSYFGVTGTNTSVIVFGLRGNAFRSTDRGATWHKVETGVQEGLTAGVALGEGGVLIASQAGRILVSQDGGERFSPVKLERATPASAVQALGTDAVVVAGARGVRVQPLR